MRHLFAALAMTLWIPAAAALAANPATTLTGSTVENVDTGKQTLSIKTKEGQSWTLHVTDPQLIKKYDIKKGDQISVEVDTNNNVINIAKAGETPRQEGAAH